MAETPDLSSALALSSDEDRLRLYQAWAATYDEGFAEAMAYRLPGHVAAAVLAAGGEGPVLDAGAGTGLLAGALRAQGFAGQIDGVDLSPEMLAVAGAKGIYRHLVQADVTRPLPLAGGYAGVVSSGTFTHGHVGPEAFGPLLASAAPGALFAFSVNAGVWAALGFDRALAALGRRISGLEKAEMAIYGPAAAERDPDHAAQTAWIVRFRKV
jgi:predicted TPR repeat methyltransferase